MPTNKAILDAAHPWIRTNHFTVTVGLSGFTHEALHLRYAHPVLRQPTPYALTPLNENTLFPYGQRLPVLELCLCFLRITAHLWESLERLRLDPLFFANLLQFWQNSPLTKNQVLYSTRQYSMPVHLDQ